MATPNVPFSPARQAETRQPVTIALSTIFPGLACIAVCLRLYTRSRLVRRVGNDDIAIAIAMVFSLGVCALTVVAVTLGGLGRHVEFVTPPQFQIGAKTSYASVQVYNVAQLLTKISFLLQYRRIFPSERIRKIALCGLGFLVVWGVVQLFLNIFICAPLAFLLPNWHKHCISTWPVYNLSGVMNIVTDVMIFSIPIQPVITLRIPRTQKAYLLVVFSLGFFVCAISIIRFYKLSYNWHSPDVTWDGATGQYWSNVELNLGIICACLPTLRPLVAKYAPSLVESSGYADPRNNKLNTVHLTGTSSGETNTTGHKTEELEFQTTAQSHTDSAKASVTAGEHSPEKVRSYEVV